MVNVLRTTAVLAGLAASTAAVAQAGADFKLTGINYNIRAGPDWAPANEKCKPASQITSELATIKTITDTIRIYSLTDCDIATALVPVAIEAGLQIELGLWVDSDANNFEAEKAAFSTLLGTGVVTTDNMVGIHVGSEAVYRKDVNAKTAIKYLNDIRTLAAADTNGASAVPLTIADIGDIYTEYPEMIEAVDYVSANYFPFWEKVDVDGAADYFYERFSALVTTAKDHNKEVIVGETGWASDGVDSAASDATAANAAQYFSDFYKLAEEKDLMYFYFSGFDAHWKLATLEANETVEAYFGLFTVDGVLKDEYAQLSFGNSSSSGSATIESSSSAATITDDATTTDATMTDASTTDATTTDATSGSAATTSTTTAATADSAATTSTTSGKDCAM